MLILSERGEIRVRVCYYQNTKGNKEKRKKNGEGIWTVGMRHEGGQGQESADGPEFNTTPYERILTGSP